jgi:hypothetical protein
LFKLETQYRFYLEYYTFTLINNIYLQLLSSTAALSPPFSRERNTPPPPPREPGGGGRGSGTASSNGKARAEASTEKGSLVQFFFIGVGLLLLLKHFYTVAKGYAILTKTLTNKLRLEK